MYDFANLLFSGPCNARCYFCIGRQLDPVLSPDNLSDFPPQSLEAFIDLIRQHEIKQLVLSGTNADPQLYQHEERLLPLLREQLPAETQLSLHTNGRLALRKIQVLNRYDRAVISLPSFDPVIYYQMMGVPRPPNLPEILRQSRIPIKVSCLVSRENAFETPRFLKKCWELGVPRIVLRKPFGEHKPWEQLIAIPWPDLRHRDEYRANPVFDFQGMEVTLWDFDRTTSRSINLFASGLISPNYRLIDAGGFSLNSRT